MTTNSDLYGVYYIKTGDGYVMNRNGERGRTIFPNNHDLLDDENLELIEGLEALTRGEAVEAAWGVKEGNHNTEMED
tara:strand:- start:225 stop:455 length:231 start_codon:yes stop_codon:yes gene_type:complete